MPNSGACASIGLFWKQSALSIFPQLHHLHVSRVLLPRSSLESRDHFCVSCRPQGATSLNPPAIGTDLSSLSIDILRFVKDIRFQRRVFIEARDQGLCCREMLNCVNVQSLNVSMCYDKLTTNLAFTDESYGSLTTGGGSSSRNSANLISGGFTALWQIGNIYADDPGERANSTLFVPPQYTAAGIGYSIPANHMGSVVVHTTKIPAVTYSAPTTAPQSGVVNTVSGQTVVETASGTTLPQHTTIMARTTAVMSTQVSEVSSTATAGAASSPAAARRFVVDVEGMPVGGVLAYVLYAFSDRELRNPPWVEGSSAML